MNKRENNMDLLRVIASIMVIALHAGAIYSREINLDYPIYYFTVGNFYHSITRTAVPVFVMLSGAFLLGNKKNTDYKFYYQKILKNIVKPVLIFSVFYVVFEICTVGLMHVFTGSEMNYLQALEKWVLGKPYYHMWYMYMMLGCYMITPILIKVRLSIKEKKFNQLGWVFIVIGMFMELMQIRLIWPLQFLQYLGYFILGYTLKCKNEEKSGSYIKYLIGSIMLLLVVFLLTEYNIRYSVLESKFYFLEPLSPVIVVSSIFMYIGFLRMKDLNIKRLDIANHTFNIYLVHAAVLGILAVLINVLVSGYPNPIWSIPILIVSVFWISYKISVVIENKSKGIKNNKVENKLNEKDTLVIDPK